MLGIFSQIQKCSTQKFVNKISDIIYKSYNIKNSKFSFINLFFPQNIYTDNESCSQEQ